MKLNRIYTWLRHPGESLSQRVVRAGFWAFALRITSRLFGLARTIVLARLLAPNDFGLYGIALLSLSALETFSQTGLNQALIQKKGDTKPYLDTAWTVQVIRGFVLAAILVVGAPLVGSFFAEPRAVLLVRVLGAGVLLKSLQNIGVVYFRKDLEFHKQFIYEFSGTFADLAVAIPAAFILRSVWALVFGLLAGNLVRMVVSYFIHSYRPHLGFNREQFKELFSFGRWILGSSILVFLVTQGDDILVGKLLGVAALGFYQLAYRISNMPATEITHVISQVTFPAYSKLQDTVSKLRNAYLKVLQLTAFISIPLAGLIFILAPDFTKIFLGEKWMPMVPAMQILVLAGLIRSIMATTGPIFEAVGKPGIATRLQVVRLIVLGASIYPLISVWGILGASVSVFLGNLVSTIGFISAVLKVTSCKRREWAKMIAFPLIAELFMALSMFALKVANTTIGIQTFFILAGVGISTYLSATYLLDRFANYGIKVLIKEGLR